MQINITSRQQFHCAEEIYKVQKTQAVEGVRCDAMPLNEECTKYLTKDLSD